jgi:hypothetical protein
MASASLSHLLVSIWSCLPRLAGQAIELRLSSKPSSQVKTFHLARPVKTSREKRTESGGLM